MATTYSTQAGQINNVATGGILNEPRDLGGRIRCAFFSKTCASEAVADVIRLTKLPKGARILSIRWGSQDLSSAGAATIEIGDSGDSDRFVSAFDVGTAAIAVAHRTMRTPTTEVPDIGYGYITTDETWITATVGAFALNTGIFWGNIEYVVD